VFSESDSRPIDHAVVLIGWDDSKQAWIIKNSWGSAWGDDGFLYVKYGTNSIGFGAAWAEAWPKDYAPTPKIRMLLNNSLKSTAKTAKLPE
jgi:cathepsin L